MAHPAIIDAFFCIPKRDAVRQMSDCVPFSQDLTPLMNSCGIAGAILAMSNCAQCQHRWNCADRRTQEIVNAVARNPKQLCGLAAYDPLRIGESLRWIDAAITEGGLVGAYVQAECCISGLDVPRMYPLYGLCAMLGTPVLLDVTSLEQWAYYRPQVEVVAADFPELDVLVATPPKTDSASIIELMQHFSHISFLLCPGELRADAELSEYVELEGREHALFRSSPEGWAPSVEAACTVPLGVAARRAYLGENAMRLFRFPVEAAKRTA
jgi:hypothetical protein